MIPAVNITDIFSHDHNFQAIMKNMLQTTFEISFDGVMITESGPGYPIVYVNPAFSALTGYTLEEMIGKSPSILQGEQSDKNVLAQLKETIEKGEIFHGRTVNYRKDATAFIMEWKIVPIHGKDDRISHYLALQRAVRDDELDSDPFASQLSFDRS